MKVDEKTDAPKLTLANDALGSLAACDAIVARQLGSSGGVARVIHWLVATRRCRS